MPFTGLPDILLPFLIFLLRTLDLALATSRILSIAQGRRLSAWVLGFTEALVFVGAMAGVLDNLSTPLNWLAFAAGFGTGNVVGIAIQDRWSSAHSLLRIISRRCGLAICETLREEGFGVTEVGARGRDGTVGFILCYVPRRSIDAARDLVLGVDPEAFVTAEDVIQLRGGWKA